MTVWPVSSSAAHAEGRVLLCEALERDGQLLLVSLGLRLDSLVYYRLREYHLLEHDPARLRRRPACRRPGLRETDRRHQLARVDLLALLSAVRVQLQEPTDALAPPFVVFITYEPLLSVPEYTLMYVSFPTCGSACTLKASAASGPSRRL
jgi:hypothetical protein